MSSGSKEVIPSDRHASVGGGSASSTKEAGQRPRREVAEQISLLDEGYTAAPEADRTVSTKLAGLVARARREARLTNVVQYVDEELLRLAFGSLRKQAAPGVDGQSYEDYAVNLDQNLKDLYARLKNGRYQAPVIRRVYIPKANGKLRPLGITTIEDRVVQKAAAWVIGAVFEQDFLDCSYGFRPNRSAHGALHRLREGMMQHWARYVVEVDVVNYFGAVNWAWLRTFVRHRINDGGLIRLLNKWLKAGVMENGVVTLSSDGVPQGGPVSPVLANVYLHYVLDLWFERRFKKACRGYAELTRFADDFVAAFKYHADAVRFRQENGRTTRSLWSADRAREDGAAALRRQLTAWRGPTGDQAGDLHLPWVHPLSEESAQWASQHRAEAERQSTRTVYPQSGGMAQGKQASQRLGPAGSSGESAQVTTSTSDCRCVARR